MGLPGIRVRLTEDVERGAYKGVDWITTFKDKAGAEYEVIIKDKDGVWVASESTGLRIKLHPDEYEIISEERPKLRLV